jgi:hypothetical protein
MSGPLLLEDDAVRTRLGFAMDFGTAIIPERAVEKYDCGCAACIGGHLSLMMQGVDVAGSCFTKEALKEAAIYVSEKDGHPILSALFYPSVGAKYWPKISPPIAAKAIENTLTTGRPEWKRILADEEILVPV